MEDITGAIPLLEGEKDIIKEVEVESKYARFKGADWFSWLKGKEIIIGGAGGIGSWFSLFISRLGCNIYIYDMDTFESHNMSGQLVRQQDINKSKTDVAEELAKEFSTHTVIEGMGKYEIDSEYSPIMISCFDNMKARKDMFNNWKQQLIDNPEIKQECIFIDGRLLAETYQIFCIQGDDSKNIIKYETEFLFDDAEVDSVDCTFKQTSHCAAGIASHMTGFLTNFASNVVNKGDFNQIPFKFEYITPINYVENVV